MKKLFTIACVSMLYCNAFAQNKPDEDAMMKAWMSYMTPGDAHKMLAADDGTWKQETTMWWGPGAEPQKSTMTATNKMIMGNRYQESVSTGTVNGMPFEGRSVVGYNNASKTFQSTWVDNMGTGIMYMESKPWDGKSKTIEFHGTMVDPMTGKTSKVREMFTMVDDNTRKMEMFDNHDGKEFKSMEIMMTRQK
jgi:hypothetical protein